MNLPLHSHRAQNRFKPGERLRLLTQTSLAADPITIIFAKWYDKALKALMMSNGVIASPGSRQALS